VAAHVVAAARQHGVQLAVAQEQRHEHGGVGAPVDVELGRGGGVEEHRAQLAREVSSRA
jgi:hypothetical protein